MERLTAQRCNGIKTGYWSPAKKDDLARQAMAAEPELHAACTTCALKAGVAAGGKH